MTLFTPSDFQDKNGEAASPETAARIANAKVKIKDLEAKLEKANEAINHFSARAIQSKSEADSYQLKYASVVTKLQTAVEALKFANDYYSKNKGHDLACIPPSHTTRCQVETRVFEALAKINATTTVKPKTSLEGSKW